MNFRFYLSLPFVPCLWTAKAKKNISQAMSSAFVMSVEGGGRKLNGEIETAKANKTKRLFDLKRSFSRLPSHSKEQRFFDSLTNCSFQQLANEYSHSGTPSVAFSIQFLINSPHHACRKLCGAWFRCGKLNRFSLTAWKNRHSRPHEYQQQRIVVAVRSLALFVSRQQLVKNKRLQVAFSPNKMKLSLFQAQYI